ncbi:MAG: FtsX-like permease family protein [Candidatus Binatia bacterium]
MRIGRLLRTMSWPSYRAAPGRLALIIGGIAAGVALLAAIGLVNASVLANFRTMVERTAGRAALQVVLGTGEIGFDDAALGVVGADPDVRHAFGMVRGSLHAADGSGEVLQLFGVDLVSDAIDAYDVRVVDGGDALELLNDPESVLLAAAYATRRGIAVDARPIFATPSGVRALRVRGVLTETGLATVFGGSLAVMDLPAAQQLLGKVGRVDQIDVILVPGADVEGVRRRLAAALPASLSVERPEIRGERVERAVGAFQAMLDGLSLLCLLASIFIVYNTTATAVTERGRDLAVLRLVGIEHWRVFLLVLAEAAVLGLIASVIGIALGVGLARLLTSLVAESMGAIYQVRFPVDRLALSGAQIVGNVALGVGAAMLAAILPARRASRMDPIALMRSDYREQLALVASNGQLVTIGALLLAAAIGAVGLELRLRSIAWGNAGAMLWWLAGLVLSVPAMSAISRLCRRPLTRWFGGAGRIAAAGLLRAPGRTGVTVGVIALSLTVAIALASSARSFRESQRHLPTLVGDLVVSAIGTEGGWLESPLNAAVGDVLARLPGVARVETYRVLQGLEFRGARVAVVAVSPGFVDSPQFRRMIVAGDGDDAVRAIAEDRAVVVSDNLAEPFGLGPGDEIRVSAPGGPVTMRIAAVLTNDFSGDRGSIIMHRDRYAALWGGDTQVSHFNVFLAPGVDLEAARGAIVAALRDAYRVKILTLPQLVAYHQRMIDQAFAFTYAIQLLVIAVTLAGIVDLLSTQIIERRREMGLLRLIGADESVVARAIWLEALVIGLAGAAIGAVISVGTSLIWVRINFRILIGYIVEHHFASLTALWCVVLAGAVAMVAGRLAARRALRDPVLEALRYE